MRSDEDAVGEAAKRNLSRVTTRGFVWVRDGVDKASAWDAVMMAREAECERCAKIAEDIEGGFDHPIADAIRKVTPPRTAKND